MTLMKPTPMELAEGMKKQLNEMRANPNKEKSTQTLIRIGVLDANGKQKKQICTGGYYVGK